MIIQVLRLFLDLATQLRDGHPEDPLAKLSPELLLDTRE